MPRREEPSVAQVLAELGAWSPLLREARRFWSYVMAASEDGCWLWTGGTSGRGYPYFRCDDGTVVPAAHWAYASCRGPIPAGHRLGDSCGVRACIHPWHHTPVCQTPRV